jgi:hypothetical protein
VFVGNGASVIFTVFSTLQAIEINEIKVKIKKNVFFILKYPELIL